MSGELSTAITCFTYGATVSVSWPVPHPRSPTTSDRVDQPEHGPEEKRVAEQIFAQPIPLAGGGREKFL